jgi:porin
MRACVAMVVAAVFSALATMAHAQAVRSDNPAPPAQSYLTGDWGGLRSLLDSYGVNIAMSDTNDLLANVRGGIKAGSVNVGALQPQLNLDLQKLAGLEGDRIHIHGLVTYGPLFSSNYLGNILGASNIEAGPMARLYALWYEHNAPEDRWSIRFGLMLADSQFLTESDRIELHQQRHQLADVSRCQSAGLGTSLSFTCSRHSHPRAAA